MQSETAPVVHQCQCRECREADDASVMEYHHTSNLLLTRLSEPQRRWYVASLAQGPHALGLRHLALITGLDRTTIRRGIREVSNGLADLQPSRQRRAGGGQPPAEKKTPSLKL